MANIAFLFHSTNCCFLPLNFISDLQSMKSFWCFLFICGVCALYLSKDSIPLRMLELLSGYIKGSHIWQTICFDWPLKRKVGSKPIYSPSTKILLWLWLLIMHLYSCLWIQWRHPGQTISLIIRYSLFIRNLHKIQTYSKELKL